MAQLKQDAEAVGLGPAFHVLGPVTEAETLLVRDAAGTELLRRSREAVERLWSQTSYHMARLRDDATCADEEQAALTRPEHRLALDRYIKIDFM